MYVCMYVCMYVRMYVHVCMYIKLYMCVRSNLPPHTLESQKRDTNGFIAMREPFFILLKMLCSKVMAEFAHLEQLRRPSAGFFLRNKLLR